MKGPCLLELAANWRLVASQLRLQAEALSSSLPEMKTLLISKALVYESCATEFEVAYLRGDQ